MAEIYLNEEAASVANAIRSIDAKLDDLERRINNTLTNGMRNTMVAAGTQEGRDRADDEHARLLEERGALVTRLKELVGEG